MKRIRILILFILLITIIFIPVKAEGNKTLINIDYPTANQELSDSLRIQGWVMSTVNTKVEVYVDNKIEDVSRPQREDVLKIIKGYGDITTNPTPGIYKVLDISNYKNGNHTVKVRVLDKNNKVIKESTRQFKKVAPKTLINIDYPTVNQELCDSLRIQGWVMSTANTKVEVYVDNNKVEDVSRPQRPDVLKIIKGYGDITTNPTPGIYKVLDISNYSYGNHTVKVRVLDKNNKALKEETRQFKKGNPKTLINIDYPTVNQEVSDSLRIQGWVMSTANTKVEVYVDNNKIEDVTRPEREDVLKIIKGYGDINTNPTPGIYKVLDISNYSYGNHTLKVRVLDKNNKVIKEATRQFKKGDPKTLINIDYPTVNQEVSDSLRIQGWVMSTANTKVEVYVDNNKIEDVSRPEREDVLKIIKGYGDITTNPTPGIYKVLDISNYSYGNHTLKVRVLDKNNKVIKESTRQFKKATPKTLINIDYPTVNQEIGDSLRIQGWVMSKVNTKVEVYIDNNKIEDVTRPQRPDVLKIIKGYGDITTNPTPGIYKILDISNYNYGKHTLKVRVLDTKDRLIKEETRQFNRPLPNTLVYVDFPTANQEIEKALKIQGWVMSTANTSIEVYIDNKKIDNITRTKREDVLKIIKGYGTSSTNPTPGYSTTYNAESLTYGEHTLKIRVLDKAQKEVKTYSTKFKRKKPKSNANIDSPSGIANRIVTIKGWYLTMENNTHAEVYFDDTKVESVTPLKRDDAINAYPEYKTYMENQNPGYSATYDATSLKDGTHKVTVKIINDTNHDVINTYSKNFTLQKYKGKINIDFPALGNTNKDFSIVGWEMSELDNSYIKVYIDNKDISNTFTRYARQDVIENVSGYGDASVNATPGFSADVAISSIGEGKHTIKIELYTKQNEKIDTAIKNIYVYTNIYNGIDISSHNYINSWQNVKKAGIDYVIARAAVRGYGTAGNLLADSTFVDYVNKATAEGIKVGAYVYSQAITEAEGIQEVDLMIKQVNAAGGKNKVTLPLIIDTEFSTCEGRCGRADGLSVQQRTKIVKAMAEEIKAKGYTPMIYASTNFLNNQLDMNQLREYSVWVAHYGVEQPTYKGTYEIWQYTSTGTVPGINGTVDLDYFYKKY